MLKNIIFYNFSKIRNQSSAVKQLANITPYRQIHCGVCLRNPRHTSKPNNVTSPAIASKYQVITEENSPIIGNTAEEIHSEEKYPILSDEFDGINLESRFYSYT